MADPTTNNTPTNETGSTNSMMRYGTILVVVLIALGVGYYLVANGLPENGAGAETETNETGPVAIVNGEEVSRDTYTQAYAQYEALFGQLGQNVSGAQLQTQTLNDLVNSVLLKQAAVEAGYTASDDDVDAEIDAIIANAGGAEAFATQIADAGLDEAEVRRQVAEQLAINAYVRAETEADTITVTEEEIASFYDELSAQNETLPPLEEVQAQIEEQIRGQKQQERIDSLVAELRADADIEILI